MADNNHQQLLDDGGDDIFVYMGGEQEVPHDVKRARIDESIDTVPRWAFAECQELIEVEGHNKLKKIEGDAFYKCRRLRWLMKMGGVIEIEKWAFAGCNALIDLDFVKLEIIGYRAFCFCESLRSINLPSVRGVAEDAFWGCTALTEAAFGEDLGRIEGDAFRGSALRRIAIPLKDGLVIENNVFNRCDNLAMVDVIGAGIHKTISSLHMKSWRDDIREVIESINQTLPDTRSEEKGAVINQWIESVLRRMEHYKTEHQCHLLHDEEGRKCEAEEKMSQKAKIDVNCAREDHRVTCGANIVIKNVLPFLALG